MPDQPALKVAFLVNDLQLSGGVGVVVAHARQLAERHGFDVSLVLVREQELAPWGHRELEHVRVLSLSEARAERYDVAVSTWWETVFSLFLVPAARYASFVQSLEDRFYRPHDAEQLFAGLMVNVPVAFITEAQWIADTLADLRPEAQVSVVRNGIDKSVFPVVDALSVSDGPLRVLVEGYASTWFKGVNRAIAAVRAMSEPHSLTVVAPDRTGLDDRGADRVLGPVSQAEMVELYRASDVVVKLSSVEGMYGPPLEGFHCGATCVTTEVTGFDEYIRHGSNALVVDWDDERGTARMLDLLARDRSLLARLRQGAVATARDWPSWEEQGALMAGALRSIASSEAPDPYAAAGAMLAGLRGGLDRYRKHLQERGEFAARASKLERLKGMPVVSHALRLQGSRSGRLLLRLARPARRRLLGP